MTVKEYRKIFFKNKNNKGWKKDITFHKLTIEEAINNTYIRDEMYKNREFFRLNETGNIYDEKGEIAYYNIKWGLQ